MNYNNRYYSIYDYYIPIIIYHNNIMVYNSIFYYYDLYYDIIRKQYKYYNI